MDFNNLIGCITTITNDNIVIDDSKFPIFDIQLDGDEFVDTELKTMVCASKTD